MVSIYIDVDIKERHKLAGTNISQACNAFLKTYFQDEEAEQQKDIAIEVQNLRAKLAQANTKLESHKQKVRADSTKQLKLELQVAVTKLKQLKSREMAGGFIKGDEFKALFDATMAEFGLTRKELVDKVL